MSEIKITRYQAMRKHGIGPFTAGVIAFFNFLQGVPEGYICFMHVIIEYDVEE